MKAGPPPERQCVNITGDAGVGYMLGNLEALVRHGIGVTTVHIKNGGFSGYGPGFWGPGHDWVPDHNWGGSGMIGLQEMLLQTHGKEILLFPAWPDEWDVDFKLHAPYNTTIEASLRNGELIKLRVYPENRKKDVEIHLH